MSQPPHPPTGTTVHRDLFYVTDGHPRQTLDLYLPPTGRNGPLIIWVHGGAFRMGSKENKVPLSYLAEGYAVASINYRLSQHALFPAQIQDCKAAVRWLRAHAGNFGFDPDRIGVWGTSAGGHLASMVGSSEGVEELEGPGNLGFSSAATCVAVLSGPSDLLAIVGEPSSIDRTKDDCPESQLIGGGLLTDQPDKARAASPVTYVDGNEPPYLILHGTKDNTVPYTQAEIMAEALEEAGCDVTFIPIENGNHGLGGRDTNPSREEWNKSLAEFFATHLQGE